MENDASAAPRQLAEIVSGDLAAVHNDNDNDDDDDDRNIASFGAEKNGYSSDDGKIYIYISFPNPFQFFGSI